MENKVLPSQSSQPALLPGRFAQRPPGILVPAQPPAIQLLELKRRVPGYAWLLKQVNYLHVCVSRLRFPCRPMPDVWQDL